MAGRFQDLPASPKELDALLRETASGPQRSDQLDPWDYVYQNDDDLIRKRVWPVVRRYLGGGEPLLRARALEFVVTWTGGYADTLPALLDTADNNAPLFAEQAVENTTLRDLLLRALVAHINYAGNERRHVAQALLRRLGSRRSSELAHALAMNAPDDLLALAGHPPGATDFWSTAASSIAVYRRDSLLPLCQALAAAEPEPLRRAVLTAVDYELTHAAEGSAEGLAARWGLPAPTLPAPTTADCHTALGL